MPSNLITPPKRKGYRKIADIPPTLLAALNAGEAESATLIEGLAIDFRVLLISCLVISSLHSLMNNRIFDILMYSSKDMMSNARSKAV